MTMGDSFNTWVILSPFGDFTINRFNTIYLRVTYLLGIIIKSYIKRIRFL